MITTKNALYEKLNGSSRHFNLSGSHFDADMLNWLDNRKNQKDNVIVDCDGSGQGGSAVWLRKLFLGEKEFYITYVTFTPSIRQDMEEMNLDPDIELANIIESKSMLFTRLESESSISSADLSESMLSWLDQEANQEDNVILEVVDHSDSAMGKLWKRKLLFWRIPRYISYVTVAENIRKNPSPCHVQVFTMDKNEPQL